MKFRCLSPEGDLTAPTAVLQDHEACIAALRSRLALFRGEWWENPEIGFAVPDYLISGLRSDLSLQSLSGFVSAFILETPGIRSLSELRTSRSGHRFFYSCTVTTDWSRESSVSFEVDV